jgi:hypothetical protein
MGRYLRECDAKYRYMHTLTYPGEYPSDGVLVKYQLKRYLQEISRLAAINGRKAECSHFWFIEFQKRGAPHFHIFTTEFVDYKLCAELWYEIVASGDYRHLKAGVRVEKLIRGRGGLIVYAKKYAKKQEQKQIPAEYRNVGKFWGVNGLKTRKSADTIFFADKQLKKANFDEKMKIFDIINQFVEHGGARLAKSSFGFRMFVVDTGDPWYGILMKAIKDSAERLRIDDEELFFDADTSDYAHHVGYDLRSGEKSSRERLYYGVKNGEVSWH